MSKPLVIGVAGGTGSGKTTIVRKIVDALDSQDIVVLQHDSYYRDRSHITPEQRILINYDHPEALETDLLIHHLEQLIANEPTEIPVYDFATHIRRPETITVKPANVMIVEGILIFVDPKLRSQMAIKIYVDTDDDIRFIRRMERDIHERGRSLESVVRQYLTSVKPMHLEFVEPSKRYADIVIPEGGLNQVAVDMIIVMVKSIVNGDHIASIGT
jgi:uridine kinase